MALAVATAPPSPAAQPPITVDRVLDRLAAAPDRQLWNNDLDVDEQLGEVVLDEDRHATLRGQN